VDWVFEFPRSPHDVTVTARGPALATEFNQLFEALCADKRFEPGMLILLDLRKVNLDRVPQMELGKVSDALPTSERNAKAGPLRLLRRSHLQPRCCALLTSAATPTG